MPISIRPYTEAFIPAVQAFNARLAAGGVEPGLLFQESPTPIWLPRIQGRDIYQEFFLAVDGEYVRGGFILKRQPFWVFGQLKTLTFYHGPISEGIIDRAFASVGVLMVRAALKVEPRLFALGMGGFEQPLPLMLKALGWRLETVPFWFHVQAPRAFLRNVAALNRTTKRRAVSHAAASTGLGGLGVRVLQLSKTRKPRPAAEVEPIEAFAGAHAAWVDRVWENSHADYAMIGARDHRTLDVLYPRDDVRFLRLRVHRQGATLGWAVALDTQKRGDRHFGNLRLGSIVDALARPADAPAVVWAVRQFLKSRGVDLIVSNQSHASWGQALSAAGFLSAPSNFAFGASKALSEELGPATVRDLHLNRGDGDGPIHL